MAIFFNLQWFSVMQCNAPLIIYNLLGEIYTQLALVGEGLRKVKRRDLFSIWSTLKVFRQVNDVITLIFYWYSGDGIKDKLE